MAVIDRSQTEPGSRGIPAPFRGASHGRISKPKTRRQSDSPSVAVRSLAADCITASRKAPRWSETKNQRGCICIKGGTNA